MRATKIILTALTNLQAKYGTKTAGIKKSLNQLIKADKARGIQTKIVYIDDPASVRKLGVKLVKNITPAACKRIIDDLYQKHVPDYIVLFGAQDVIPFVALRNPASEDEDPDVPSDLPYACDTRYSKNVQTYIGPTRVVGRIPDVPGSGDPAYINRLISSIIHHTPRPKKYYLNYFAVSARVWQTSTRQSVQHIFGGSQRLLLSPGSSAKYNASQLKAASHFYNCHGAASDANFYGQQGSQYPVALNSRQLTGKISPGTIVAAECCYGAELVPPRLLTDTPFMSIANTYLYNNAISFVGSSNTAYGPADGQGLADLVTQYFMKNVLNGASAGRALLQARQQFLSEVGPQLDPYELKTLAQFCLLGDPSITPVTDDSAKKIVARETVQNTRFKLFKKGAELHHNLAPCHPEKKLTPSVNQKQINTLLKQTGFSGALKKGLYKTEKKPLPATAMINRKMVAPAAQFRTFVKETRTPATVEFNNTRVLVIKEAGNQVLGWRVYERK